MFFFFSCCIISKLQVAYTKKDPMNIQTDFSKAKDKVTGAVGNFVQKVRENWKTSLLIAVVGTFLGLLLTIIIRNPDLLTRSQSHSHQGSSQRSASDSFLDMFTSSSSAPVVAPAAVDNGPQFSQVQSDSVVPQADSASYAPPTSSSSLTTFAVQAPQPEQPAMLLNQ